MRVRKREDAPPPAPAPEPAKVSLPVDGANESTVVAAAFLFPELRERLLLRLSPEHFQQREHRELWEIFRAAGRRKLVVDLALAEQLGGPPIREYVAELAELKPDAPKNLEHHVAALLWDASRVACVRGPIPEFFEALRDPKADPSRTKALAKAIALSLEGHDDRRHLHDPASLVSDVMRDVEERVGGRAAWAYGIESFDYYAESKMDGPWGRRRRMLPGPAPEQTTVLMASPGVGKTTVAALFALGIAFPGWERGDFDAPGRRVLYGAFEMQARVNLETFAIMTLGWSRSEASQGVGKVATREGREELRARAALLATRIRFMSNPIRRHVGERPTNAKSLDLLQGYVADSGAEVVFTDLFHRLLVDMEPHEELQALYRVQAIFQETATHGFLLHQLSKVVEQRANPTPQRGDAKGSSGWTEIPDTQIAVHRPALYKGGIADDRAQLLVLKQRHGLWPVAVEFDWDGDVGRLRNGRSVQYLRSTEDNPVDAAAGGLAGHLRGRGRA